LSNGYVENGPPVGGFGTSSGYPMTKALATIGRAQPMECTIRPAREDDADEISAVILRTLREANAKDYAREIIKRIEHSFSPSAVQALISKRTVFVAAIGSRVVGTASLDGSVVHTVFVSPDVQTRGIGKLLMAEVERTARQRNISTLAVPSSIGAETFYAQLGFKAVRDSYYGEERTIIMERSLEDRP
jgi:N-acetylglutamate synthase-like GNAT family acetyltransferase